MYKFRKFEKIKNLYNSALPTSDCLTQEQTFELLNQHGPLTVTEKLDGYGVGILFTQHGYMLFNKFGFLKQEEDPPFIVFKQWVESKYDPDWSYLDGTILYGELLFNTQYKQIPSPVLVHSVWQSDQYLSWSDLQEVCMQYGFATVPVCSYRSLPDLKKYTPSILGGPKEGYVFTNRQGQYGKYVFTEKDRV